MSSLLQRTANLVALWLTVHLGSGCSNAPGRVSPPVYSSLAGESALNAYDSNHDLVISGDEFDRVPALRASLSQVDADANGAVTADEIDARVQSWRDSRIAEMPVRCEITLDGAPLPDASIVFDPEPFLGGKVKPASGVTIVNGVAGISLANEYLADPKYAGVACGWYKIRISSSSRSIPERYNLATVLGCEVAMNAAWVNDGAIKIELTSR